MLKRGDQIIYIPNHARGSRDHPDSEYGFVTSVIRNGETAFCRYWSKINPNELRTTANSEATSVRDLQLFKSMSQKTINNLLEKLKGGEDL